MTAARYVQSVTSTTWTPVHDRGQCWRCTRRRSCTRIRRRWTLRSCCKDYRRWSTGRCHGHTSWTSCRPGIWVYHRRYPSSQTPEARSYATPRTLRTNCTRRSTSWDYATARQISACTNGLVSADWADRCRASSCLSIESLNPTLNSAHERLKKSDPRTFCWIRTGTQLAVNQTSISSLVESHEVIRCII